jgi:hypothetical protein
MSGRRTKQLRKQGTERLGRAAVMMGIPNSHCWFRYRPRLRYWLAFVLALIWTLLWGCARWPYLRFYFRCASNAGRVAWCHAFSWGRRECPEPVVCKQCGWAGPGRRSVHTYEPDGCGDVEPVDECPRCRKKI